MQYSKQTMYIAAGIAGAILLITLIYATSGLFTPAFKISSPAFAENGMIPATYTCDGEGLTPPLEFSNIPENTRSIVVYVFDPDAPKNGFVHWVLYGIDPTTQQIAEGTIPSGSVEGLNSSEKQGYQPLCPPSGTHRYLFTAYAASSTYHFVKAPNIAQLKKVMRWQVLAKSTLTGKYTRQ